MSTNQPPSLTERQLSPGTGLPHQNCFTPAAIAGVTPPMVGRDSELHQLLGHLHTTIAGGSLLVIIDGPTGIGKSRLMYEFRQLVARMPDTVTLLSLPPDAQGRSQPYQLVRMLVAALFGIATDDPPASVRTCLEQGVATLVAGECTTQAHMLGLLAGYQLGDSPQIQGLRAEPHQLREGALRCLADCLTQRNAEMPLVVLCDDLHQADDGSLDALGYLVQESSGLLVVGCAQPQLYTRRPDWATPTARVLRHELGPLDATATSQLVSHLLQRADQHVPALWELIVRHAEGQPLYVAELIKMLIADGVIVPGTQTWQLHPRHMAQLRLPASLAELLGARIAALPPAAGRLLAQAAVIGRSFWVEAATQLNPQPTRLSNELLELLVQQQLIIAQPSRLAGQPEYAFTHDLLHQAAYQRVPPEQRPDYHRRVAAWLIDHSGDQVGAYASLIAEHYEQGHDARAADWYLRAGDTARDGASMELAERHYRTALRLLPDLPATLALRIACYEGLGQAQLQRARLEDMRDSYSQMAQLAEAACDLAAAARAWDGLWKVHYHNCDLTAAVACGQRAIALAEVAGDHHQRIDSLLDLGWTEYARENPHEALQLGQLALALAQPLDPRLACLSLALIGTAYEKLGAYDAALDHLHQALAQQRALGQLGETATHLNNLGTVANAQGDFQAALAYLDEARQLAQSIGSRIREIYILSNMVAALNGLGDHQAAEQAARRGIALSSLSRMIVFAEFYSALAEAYVGQGRASEAVEAARQALDAARNNEGPREVALAWRAMGLALSALSDHQGAPPCFAESVRLFSELGFANEQARSLRAWATYELRHGQRAHGQQLWEQAHSLFAAGGLAHELARTPLASRTALG